MSTMPLVKEILIQATPERVWQAISDKNEMKQWYFDLADFRPEPGFEFSFSGGPPEKQYLHLCRVMESIPPQKLSYSWRYDGYEGDSLVTFELFKEGEMTRVRLTHSGLETFPPLDDFKRANFDFGWTSLIQQMLKSYVETGKANPG
jgi:uncharacterized protein YndB with AHSA1/START domain